MYTIMKFNDVMQARIYKKIIVILQYIIIVKLLHRLKQTYRKKTNAVSQLTCLFSGQKNADQYLHTDRLSV